jgi:hypothetical protein
MVEPKQEEAEHEEPIQAGQYRLTVAVESMSTAFQEVNKIKQGLLLFIREFRDLYCD